MCHVMTAARKASCYTTGWWEGGGVPKWHPNTHPHRPPAMSNPPLMRLSQVSSSEFNSCFWKYPIQTVFKGIKNRVPSRGSPLFTFRLTTLEENGDNPEGKVKGKDDSETWRILHRNTRGTNLGAFFLGDIDTSVTVVGDGRRLLSIRRGKAVFISL